MICWAAGEPARHLVGELRIARGVGDGDPGRAALVVRPRVLEEVAPHADAQAIAELVDRDRVAEQRALALHDLV
jgi:hypothetical protein